MDTTIWSLREGRRMLQIGLLLLLFGLLVGFAIPAFVVPRLGLTAHVLGVTQGILLIVIGLLWTKLKLTRTASGIGFWMVVYGCFVSWAVTALAAAWGAGSSMMPITTGQAHGSAIVWLMSGGHLGWGLCRYQSRLYQLCDEIQRPQAVRCECRKGKPESAGEAVNKVTIYACD